MKTELVCVEHISQTACWGILYREPKPSFLAKLGAQVWQLLDWIQAGNYCQVLDPWKRLALCAYTAMPLWPLIDFRGADLYSHFSHIYKNNNTYINYFKQKGRGILAIFEQIFLAGLKPLQIEIVDGNTEAKMATGNSVTCHLIPSALSTLGEIKPPNKRSPFLHLSEITLSRRIIGSFLTC